MVSYVTAISAVVPSLLLLWYFHSRDVYPEPPRVIWITFMLGILTIMPTLLVALPLAELLQSWVADWPYGHGFLKAFLTASGPENFFKLLVLVLYSARHDEFDEPMDGIVYGVAASLGFATLENVLYVASGGLELAVTRALTAVPGHAFLGAIMGYYVGQAHVRPLERFRLYGLAYLVPVILHGLYDFPLLSLAVIQDRGDVAPVGLLITLALLVLGLEALLALRLLDSLRYEQLLLQGSLFGEHGAGKPLSVPVVGSNVFGWLLIAGGGVSTTLGGLLSLGLVFTFMFEPPALGDRLSFLLGGVIIGLVPLLMGVLVFALGLRELNRRP